MKKTIKREVGRQPLRWGRLLTVALGAMLIMGAQPTLAQSSGGNSQKAQGNQKPHRPWIKLCPKVPEGRPQVCLIRADYLDRVKGIPYAPIAIESVKGKGDSIVVTLPHVWLVPMRMKDPKTGKERLVPVPRSARWNIAAGVRVRIDDGETIKLAYAYCDDFGCVAQKKIDTAFLDKMKKGKKIYVAGQNAGQPLGLPFTLAGFTKAFDGKPVDQKAYEQAWQKKLNELRKQQMEFLKKQRANAGKGGADKK